MYAYVANGRNEEMWINYRTDPLGWETWLTLGLMALVLGAAFGAAIESYVVFTLARSKGMWVVWLCMAAVCAMASMWCTETFGLTRTLTLAGLTTAIACASSWAWSYERYRSTMNCGDCLLQTAAIAAAGITAGIALRFGMNYVNRLIHHYSLA